VNIDSDDDDAEETAAATTPDEDPFEVAWNMLETARVIFEENGGRVVLGVEIAEGENYLLHKPNTYFGFPPHLRLFTVA
jgi:hypothetical protein